MSSLGLSPYNGLRATMRIGQDSATEFGEASARHEGEAVWPRSSATTIVFGVLGPLTVSRNGLSMESGSAMLRQLLATLLCRAGQLLTVDELIDSLWSEGPPASARKSLQVYVHRLRRQLGDGRVRHGTAGYSIVLDTSELDAWQFADLSTRGHARRSEGDLDEAGELLGQALARWRGAAYADVAPSSIIAEEIHRLTDLRLVTLEERIAVDLDLGRHGELVPELRTLARAYPYREGLQAQLMLALYRAGRQVEALEVFRNLRAMLIDELGVEPGANLQRLHRQILTADPAIDARAPARSSTLLSPVVPAQLPSDRAVFVGRTYELGVMDRALTRDANVPRPAPSVFAIVGSAGVGKTALAVQWAHRAAHQFPDGQLFIDLRGYSTGAPQRMIDVLGLFLRALGVAPDAVPMEVAEAAALYRSVSAGRRLLVVLDNARSAEQVRPLLPGSPGCVVVVTSRDRLAGLVARDGAHPLPLDVLGMEESRQLLAELLGESRVGAEPQAIAELARLCAYLPLALRVAAAALIDHRRQAVATQVSALRRGNRMAALAADGDVDAGVRVAFDASYNTMIGPAQRLFRLLGLSPCADLTPRAAAALAGIRNSEALELLDRLSAVHLVQENAPGRFGSHDLLRQYAKDQAHALDGVDERQAALRRLYDWYLGLVRSAAAVLCPDVRQLPPPPGVAQQGVRISGPRHAVKLLDAERSNLVTLIRHASACGPRPMAWHLADGLRGYLDRRRHLVDLFAVSRAALAAARADGDLLGESAARLCLANAYHCLCRYRPAVAHLQKIIVLSRETGWSDAHAIAVSNMGAALTLLGRHGEAIQHLTRALDLDPRLQDVGFRARVTNNLAVACYESGRLRDGLAHAATALTQVTQVQSPTSKASVLDTLAAVERQLGRLSDALDHVSRALTLANETGSRLGQANALTTQAHIHNDAGRYEQARHSAEAALARVREIAEPRTEAYALNALGSAHDRLGDYKLALEMHSAAFDIAERGGFRYPMTEALVGLAMAAHHREDYLTALCHARRARDVAQRNQLRILEGNAISALAEISLATEHAHAAQRYASAAINIHRETEHRLGEARALLVVADVLSVTGESFAARQHRYRAHSVFMEIGAPAPQHDGVQPPGT